ncbi:hypothetical protein WH7805_01762 [Synechococcus sp. WH 7805]|nr:hypothetical protein WH7805_01762 [Synechococcus sp. WH 7805]
MKLQCLSPIDEKSDLRFEGQLKNDCKKVGLFWYPCHNLTHINPDQLATMDLDHTLKEGMLCWSGKIFM